MDKEEVYNYRKGLKGYWKKREYQRLNTSGSRRPGRAELGHGRRRRGFWRIRVPPRLRFLRRIPSPSRILTKIRDAYVKMMVSLASSGGGYGYGETVGGFGRPQVKEYDQKVLVEVYKSILAQGHPYAAANATALSMMI